MLPVRALQGRVALAADDQHVDLTSQAGECRRRRTHRTIRLAARSFDLERRRPGSRCVVHGRRLRRDPSFVDRDGWSEGGYGRDGSVGRDCWGYL